MGMIELDRLPELQLAEGAVARIVTAQNVTVAHVHLAAGAEVPQHAHVHEQVVNVIEGHLELVVDGTKFDLMPGRVMVLSPNVPHSAHAATECRVIDVFYPVREDFRGARFAGYREGDLD